MADNFRLYVHDHCTKHGWIIVGNQYLQEGRGVSIRAGEAQIYVELQARADFPDEHCWLGLIDDLGDTVWETYYDLKPGEKLFHCHGCQVVHRIDGKHLSKQGKYSVQFRGPGEVMLAGRVNIT